MIIHAPMKLTLLCLISLGWIHLLHAQSVRTLSPDERLARLEQQAAALLEEIRQFREEMKRAPSNGSSTRGITEPATPEMQPGVTASIYVRTGGADPFSPPSDQASPSDKRLHVGTGFHASTQAKAAGYDGQEVTVVWEGFFKVEDAGVYEFMLEGRSVTAQVGPKSLNARGEKTVRLDLKPGYWPIQLRDGVQVRRYSNSISFRVKRSGLDPVVITPGSLWTPKASP